MNELRCPACDNDLTECGSMSMITATKITLSVGFNDEGSYVAKNSSCSEDNNETLSCDNCCYDLEDYIKENNVEFDKYDYIL